MKTNQFVAAAVMAFAGSFAFHAATAQQLTGFHRTDIQQYDLSEPGLQVVQDRVDFDPGVVSPKHRHPGEEVVYVIEGTLEYDLDGRPPQVLKAGQGLTVPAGVPHRVKNLGNGKGAELGTYVVPKDKPLIELVK